LGSLIIPLMDRSGWLLPQQSPVHDSPVRFSAITTLPVTTLSRLILAPSASGSSAVIFSQIKYVTPPTSARASHGRRLPLVRCLCTLDIHSTGHTISTSLPISPTDWPVSPAPYPVSPAPLSLPSLLQSPSSLQFLQSWIYICCGRHYFCHGPGVFRQGSFHVRPRQSVQSSCVPGRFCSLSTRLYQWIWMKGHGCSSPFYGLTDPDCVTWRLFEVWSRDCMFYHIEGPRSHQRMLTFTAMSATKGLRFGLPLTFEAGTPCKRIHTTFGTTCGNRGTQVSFTSSCFFVLLLAYFFFLASCLLLPNWFCGCFISCFLALGYLWYNFLWSYCLFS
jgi:hypothetical protein